MDSTPIALSRAELNTLIEAASERGAKKALADVGLGDENALRDLMELRSLVYAYRAVKTGLLKSIGQMMAVGLVASVMTYIYLKR